MENDTAFYAVSYVLTRLAVIAGFGYLFYLVLRPERAEARTETARQYRGLLRVTVGPCGKST
jgi:hypothetical protein